MMQIRLQLQQQVALPFRGASILGLSDLELELLLDESHEGIQAFYQERPEHNRRPGGTYWGTSDFLARSRKVKDRVSKEQYLNNPTVLIQRDGETYAAHYNSELDERIREKLGRFEARETPSPQTSFSRAFARQRDWIKEKQTQLAGYLCQKQSQYLESRKPADLVRITLQSVGKDVGYTESTISRLARNLTIQLPDGKVIFAKELIPGNRVGYSDGYSALQQLQQNPAYYQDGKWKISSAKLRLVLKDKFSIDISRRTIQKYREKLEN